MRRREGSFSFVGSSGSSSTVASFVVLSEVGATVAPSLPLCRSRLVVLNWYNRGSFVWGRWWWCGVWRREGIVLLLLLAAAAAVTERRNVVVVNAAVCRRARERKRDIVYVGLWPNFMVRMCVSDFGKGMCVCVRFCEGRGCWPSFFLIIKVTGAVLN